MIFDWYKLFNWKDFDDEGLVSRVLTVDLTGKGEKTILITKGNEAALTVDGVFLPILFNGKNPYVIGSIAVYKDANEDVWLGYEVEA